MEIVFVGARNQGIAAAQNIGILKGLENKAEYFVFFDQDSQIQKDMIEALFYVLG